MSNLIKLIYSLNGEESSVAYDPLNKIATLKNLINLTQKINLDDFEVIYRKREIKWTDETPIKTIIGKENVPIFYIKLKAGKKHEPVNDKEEKKDDKSQKVQEIKDEKKDGKPQDKAGKSQEKDNKSNKEEKKDGKPQDKKSDNKVIPKEQDLKSEKDKPNNSKSGEKTPSNDQTKDHSFVDNDSKNLTNLKCKVIVDNLPSRPEFYSILEKFVISKHAQSDCSEKTTPTGVEVIFKNPVKRNNL